MNCDAEFCTNLLGLGFGQNANMLSAITIHDSIVAKKDNYNMTSDLLSGARTRLIPTM